MYFFKYRKIYIFVYMRGSQTLFLDIFEDNTSKRNETEEVERRKGRSAVLHSKRNECLVERYFFKGKFSGKRYNIIIDELSNEFFISPITVPEVLNENRALLIALKQKNPDKSYFQKKWQHLIW